MTETNRATIAKRRSQAGYMVATALAAVAVIGGAMAMMMTTTKTATQVSQNVSARAKLSADIDTAFNYLANTGTLGGQSNGGVTNMFYAPLPVRTEDMGKNDTPAFIGAIPQLNTVDPRGAMVGYVAFYNGRGARDLYEAQRRSLPRDAQAAEPIFINEDVDMAIQNNNLPALAMIAPGANGRIDLKTENMLKELLLAQDSSGKYQLKSANAMNQALSDAGIDDRVFAYTQQKSRDTQGETTAAVLGTDTESCNAATHKLIYQPREGGGTEFVCVPEADPALIVTDGAVGGSNSILQSAPGPLQGNRTISLRQIVGSQGIIVSGSGNSLALSFDYLQNTDLVKRLNTIDERITNLRGGGTIVTADGINIGADGLADNANRGVVFKRVNNGRMEFRTIRSADASLQIQTVGDDIIIRNTAAGQMAGRNIGGAPCGNVANQKGVELPLDGLNLRDGREQIVGDGTKNTPCATREIYAGKADALTLMFRRLEAGPGVVFSDGALDENRQPSIRITADAAAAGALVDVRNVGNGQMLARKNGGLVEIKSLVGINGTVVRTNGNVVEIGAAGGLTTGDVNNQIGNYLTANILPGASCAAGQFLTYNASATPRLICASIGNLGTNNNPVVASSDIITCRSTNPQPISGNWIKFQFTAAECGGTLPNNTYVGAIKEAVGTNGDGSVTVLNAGQAFAGWAPSGIAAGAVTGPAVAMTVGAQAGSRVTAVYIRPGSAANVSQDNFDVTFNNAVVDHTITNMANGKYTVTVYGLLGSLQGGSPSGYALRVSMNGVVARLSGFTTDVSQAPFSVTRTVNVTNGQLNVSTLLGWGGIQGINATRIGN